MERQWFTGSLTPGRLSNALSSANQGYVLDYFNICQQSMENDAHIASVINTRQLEVSNLDWSIVPATQEDKDIKVAEFCTEVVDKIPKFRSHLKFLLNAIPYGIVGNEILWQQNGAITIAGLTNIRAQNFTFVNSLQPMLANPPGNYTGVPIEPNKFIIHQADSISGLDNRAGVMRNVVIAYMMKSFSMKDWTIYSEVYHQPFRIGYYDKTQEGEIATIQDALAQIGSDASAVLPEGAKIEFLKDSKTSGESPYKEMLEYLDRQISKAVLGQTLSSDAGRDGTVGATDQAKVRQDIKIDDAKNLGDTLKFDLLTPLVWLNFEPGTLIPNFVFDTKQKPDLNKEAEKYRILTKDINLRIAEDHLYDTFGIEKPKDDQELVEPAGGSAFPQFKDKKVSNLSFKSDYSYLSGNPFSFKAVNFLDSKYLTASRDGAVITQQFYDKLGVLLQGADDYNKALGLIENYKFDFNADIVDFANSINANLNDIYTFGRQSVNPSAKPVPSFQGGLTDIGFDLIPENMLEFLKIQSFSVSHITHQNILQGIRNQMINTRQAGLPYSDFRLNMDQYFNNTGYTKLNPFHLETVYIQNGQNAYHAGKLSELTSPEMLDAFPMWRYVTIGDDRVRPSHAAMNNFTAKADNSIWQTWYPPNGFRCRCDIEPIPFSEVDQQNIPNRRKTPINPDTRQPVTPDVNFSTNPSAMGTKFSNFVESSVGWRKMRNFYTLNSWREKTAYGLDQTEAIDTMTRITRQNPDEIWGLFKRGDPMIIYLKKFQDQSGKNYYFKVEEVNRKIRFQDIISNPEQARIGVPLKTI